MFIFLILFSQVGCDWVEISQNHYRKEPLHKVVNSEYTTKSNNIYRNNSLTEKEWHRGVVDKVSNVGHVRQVQNPSVKTSSVKSRPVDNGFHKNFNGPEMTEATFGFVSAKPNIQQFNTHDENYEQNKVVWTTTTNVNQVKHTFSKQSIHNHPTSMTKNFDLNKMFDEEQSEEESGVLNQRNRVQISKPPLAETNTKFDKLYINENNKFHLIAKPNLHRLHDAVKLDTSKNSQSRFSDFTKDHVIDHAPKIKLVQREFSNNDNENHLLKKKLLSNTDYSEKEKSHNSSSHPLEEYLNSRNKFQSSKGHIDISYNDVKNSDKMSVNEANNQKHIEDKNMELTPSMDEKGTQIFPKTETSQPKDESYLSKVNTEKVIWKLMKLVTDTIYKNTHTSFKNKINYLKTLKATLLMTIEDQIDRAWPDDAGARGAGRSARSAQARGHVEFPSSESTLITISFLTFAVFVIKLVLQVIHTYKNKTMMVTPAVVTAVGRAAAALRAPK